MNTEEGLPAQLERDASKTIRANNPTIKNPQAEALQRIEHNFRYHAPKPGQPERYELLRAKAKEFALLILELTPASREQAIALTELETSVMWANAAIARHE